MTGRLLEAFPREKIDLLSLPPSLGSFAFKHPVDDEEDDGADDRGDKAGRFAFTIPMQGTADKPGEKRAGNAKENRDDEAARVFARHQKFRDCPDNETNN